MPDSSSPAETFSLRLVQCSTAVAEHRHFGRAAEPLHMSQSVVSR
ncbi:helix-turn-helix domain-containing protein [Streptomyces sp. NBC_00063]